jgi:siroheme synthase
MVRAAGAKAPTLIIIGSVVLLQDKLSWFKSKNN